MLNEVAIGAPQVSGGTDARERLLSRTLQSLAWFTEAALAVASTVDDCGSFETALMHCSPGHDRGAAAALVRSLHRLEPIDPFSPRRAEICRASVMSAAEVGGLTRYARSVYGQRLREHGYGAPVALYLWRDGKVATGVTLLREWHSPPFDAATVRMVRQLHALLQDAFGLAAEPHAAALAGGGSAASLTVREAEIARLVAGGASNAGIARSLTISEATVKAHLTRIYVKRGVRSRTQLAVVMGDAG